MMLLVVVLATGNRPDYAPPGHPPRSFSRLGGERLWRRPFTIWREV